MTTNVIFRTTRLSGRPPSDEATALYERLFAAQGPDKLASDKQDWVRHNVAPWILSHAGHDVGVGGFRIGFGDVGLELSFHFLPEVWGQGLASEFVQSALDHAKAVLREDRFFAYVETENAASIRVLEKAGFVAEDHVDGRRLMRLTQINSTAADPAR